MIIITPQSQNSWKLNAEAAWGQNLYLLGAKTVRLYWPSNLPALIDNWRVNGLTPEELTKQLLAAPVIEYKKPRPIQAIIPLDGLGLKYLESEPEPPQWALKGSLLLRCLAVIVAPPGTGKGLLAMQLGACLAASKRFFDIWDIERPLVVLYLTAEESGRTVHARAKGALEMLEPGLREEAAGRFWAFSVSGCSHLVELDGQGGLRPTESYWDLDRLIGQIGPDIVILDTFSRLFPTPENDNSIVTVACGYLEELIVKNNCAILLLHHTNKAGGALVGSKNELYSALSQSALRGASALPACARWVLSMAPLSDEYAQKVIGERAQERASGAFVAIRVSKKNEGPPESIHYLEHGPDGFFEQVEPAGPNSELSDAHNLAKEVRRREGAGEPPLSVTRGGVEAFSWGVTRSKRAAEKVLEEGLLVSRKRDSGRGFYLQSSDRTIIPPNLNSTNSKGGEF